MYNHVVGRQEKGGYSKVKFKSHQKTQFKGTIQRAPHMCVIAVYFRSNVYNGPIRPISPSPSLSPPLPPPPPPLSEYDSIYLSAGFFNGDAGAGRHFSISYKNITTATDSDPNTLETTELFRTISANNNWLRFPVTFVGLERADYNSSF